MAANLRYSGLDMDIDSIALNFPWEIH